MATEDVELVAELADMVQIGARNMDNRPLLEAVAATSRPVLLKRGSPRRSTRFFARPSSSFSRDNDRVVLCERGSRTFEPSTRNSPDIAAIPEMKARSGLPVIIDPSHGTGRRDIVAPVSLAGVAAGADGVIVEVHPNPAEALSDGPQSGGGSLRRFHGRDSGDGFGGRQGMTADDANAWVLIFEPDVPPQEAKRVIELSARSSPARRSRGDAERDRLRGRPARTSARTTPHPARRQARRSGLGPVPTGEPGGLRSGRGGRNRRRARGRPIHPGGRRRPDLRHRRARRGPTVDERVDAPGRRASIGRRGRAVRGTGQRQRPSRRARPGRPGAPRRNRGADLALAAEISDLRQIDDVAPLADVLQIGSASMQDFNLLRELGRCDRPVLLRRGSGSIVEEFLLAAEYVLTYGNGRVILCESGIRTFDAGSAPRFEINAVPVIKLATHLPVVADPSHATAHPRLRSGRGQGRGGCRRRWSGTRRGGGDRRRRVGDQDERVQDADGGAATHRSGVGRRVR